MMSREIVKFLHKQLKQEKGEKKNLFWLKF